MLLKIIFLFAMASRTSQKELNTAKIPRKTPDSTCNLEFNYGSIKFSSSKDKLRPVINKTFRGASEIDSVVFCNTDESNVDNMGLIVSYGIGFYCNPELVEKKEILKENKNFDRFKYKVIKKGLLSANIVELNGNACDDIPYKHYLWFPGTNASRNNKKIAYLFKTEPTIYKFDNISKEKLLQLDKERVDKLFREIKINRLKNKKMI